jgi:hypothetical protein
LGGDDMRVGVMAFGVYGDRVAVIEGPVRYKRTYMFRGASPSTELRACLDADASRAGQDERAEG